VRFLLDANLSGRRVARGLRSAGHDVLALSEHPELEGFDDPDVLALASEERRILITGNSKDFAPLLREWAEAGRHHAGCILVWTLGHHEFQALVKAICQLLIGRPRQRDWLDIAIAI
jgi:uncharacterized protein with PIN domain